MRSDRRKRRSLAVTSSVRRGCTTRAGVGDLRQRPRLRLRTVHESDDSFERDFHLETGGARLLAARFDLWILRDRGGDRVGQFPREPVDDVVHPRSLLRRRAGFRGASRSGHLTCTRAHGGR